MTETEEFPVGPGICVYNPPGGKHKILNTGSEVLRFVWIYAPQLASHRTRHSHERGGTHRERLEVPPGGGHMEKPSKIYYQTMTKKDVEERLKVNDIILIPFASTENHGDAQPYGEDGFIVTECVRWSPRRSAAPWPSPFGTPRIPSRTRGSPVPCRSPTTSPPPWCAHRLGLLERGVPKAAPDEQPRTGVHHPFWHTGWAKKYQVPAVTIFLDVMKTMGDALR